MKATWFGVIVAIAFLLPSPAAAQSYPGNYKGSYYFELRGGAGLRSDADNSGAGITSNIVIESQFDLGYLVDGAVGWAHRSGFRGEVALGYRVNSLDSLTIADDGGVGVFLGVGSLNGVSANTDGEVETLSAMVNGFYDIDLGNKFKPFIGVGLGIANINVDSSVLGVTIVDDDATVFAYQAMAGVSHEITESISANLMYSYFATADPSFTDTAGGSFDSEYASHNLMLGIRVSN